MENNLNQSVHIGLDFGFGKDVSAMIEVRPTFGKSVSNERKSLNKWNLPEKVKIRQEYNSELIKELQNYSWINTKEYDGV